MRDVGGPSLRRGGLLAATVRQQGVDHLLPAHGDTTRPHRTTTNPPDDSAPDTATPSPAAPSQPPPRKPRQPDQQLFTHLEKSQNPHRKCVVLLSEQDLGSLEATIELLSDAAALERLKQADAAVAAQETSMTRWSWGGSWRNGAGAGLVPADAP